MKYFLSISLIALLAASCGPAQPGQTNAYSSYGAPFDTTSVMAISDVTAAMAGKDSLDAVFRCKIAETCTKMGCWMNVENPGGEPMTVFMKDHAFGVPKEGCAGLEAIVSGQLFYDTLSVDYLRHLAEDAGKTADEIAAIIEPKPVLAVNATGVMIRGYAGEEHEGHDHSHEGHDHSHEGHDHGDEAAH